MYNSVCKI